jgi:glycosyltransferase involved in cell wall biosynthesis
MVSPGVSIIICCYNSESRIVKTLEYLQKQILSESVSWEVLVVDNASNDNTAAISNKTWSKDPVTDFQIVHEEKPGLMNARNKGLLSSAYSLVSFIDDDNWVEPNWVQKVWSIFQMNQTVGVCGSYNIPFFEIHPPDWIRKYEPMYAAGKQRETGGIIKNKDGHLWGAGLSIRKALWLQIKESGYQYLTTDRQGADLSAGGDTELCYLIRLLGYDIYYAEQLTLQHFIPCSRMSLTYLEKVNKGFGKATVRLNCYKTLLNGNEKVKAWQVELLYGWKQFIKNHFSIYLTLSQEKQIEYKLRKAYWNGYIEQMYADKYLLNDFIRIAKTTFKL